MAISKLNETGVVVMNVTCDNPPVNHSMMENLGAKISVEHMKVTLDIVNSIGKSIYCTLDGMHLLKLVRNAFGDYKVLQNGNGDIIN